MTTRIGGEWEQQRDADIQAFQENRLARAYEKAPPVVAVMLDGGRYQTRAAEAGRGVTDPGWREDKVACCQTYASREAPSDPRPQPPSKFLDRQRVTRLAAELRSRSGRHVGRGETATAKSLPKRRRRRSRRRQRPQRLRAVCQRLGEAPADAGEDDPRRVAAETLTYVDNNRSRMNYAEYWRLGLPISSAPVESVIKQLNRRVKGSEKFWLEQGAEAVLQVRAAYLSEDGRVERYWRRPRPYRRAVGGGRLRRPTAASQ